MYHFAQYKWIIFSAFCYALSHMSNVKWCNITAYMSKRHLHFVK